MSLHRGMEQTKMAMRAQSTKIRPFTVLPGTSHRRCCYVMACASLNDVQRCNQHCATEFRMAVSKPCARLPRGARALADERLTSQVLSAATSGLCDRFF